MTWDETGAREGFPLQYFCCPAGARRAEGATGACTVSRVFRGSTVSTDGFQGFHGLHSFQPVFHATERAGFHGFSSPSFHGLQGFDSFDGFQPVGFQGFHDFLVSRLPDRVFCLKGGCQALGRLRGLQNGCLRVSRFLQTAYALRVIMHCITHVRTTHIQVRWPVDASVPKRSSLPFCVFDSLTWAVPRTLKPCPFCRNLPGWFLARASLSPFYLWSYQLVCQSHFDKFLNQPPKYPGQKYPGLVELYTRQKHPADDLT